MDFSVDGVTEVVGIVGGLVRSSQPAIHQLLVNIHGQGTRTVWLARVWRAQATIDDNI